jgi:hypothetical protein
MSNLRCIVVDDVRVVRMVCGVVLVIGLGRIKALQWGYLGHDGAGKDPRFFELCDVRLGNPFLFVIAVENGRPILGTLVGALPVQLRGVVGNGEEDPKQLAVRDL